MTKDAIFTVLQGLVADHLDVAVDKVTPGADFSEDLGADSLDFVELTIAIEERFEINLDDDEVENIKTVADAAALIERRLSETPAAA